MDVSAGGSDFQMQFQEFVYYAGSIVQLLYYIVIPVIAALAFVQFKRWVDAQVPREEKAGSAAEESVSVDEFVE